MGKFALRDVEREREREKKAAAGAALLKIIVAFIDRSGASARGMYIASALYCGKYPRPQTLPPAIPSISLFFHSLSLSYRYTRVIGCIIYGGKKRAILARVQMQLSLSRAVTCSAAFRGYPRQNNSCSRRFSANSPPIGERRPYVETGREILARRLMYLLSVCRGERGDAVHRDLWLSR